MAKFNIQGLDRLIADMEKLPDLLNRKIIRDALKEAIQPLAQEIAAKAPVLSGDLRNSIKVVPGKARKPSISFNVIAEVPYVAIVEFGGLHRPATPFMRPAADSLGQDVCDQALSLIADEVEKQLKA